MSVPAGADAIVIDVADADQTVGRIALAVGIEIAAAVRTRLAGATAANFSCGATALDRRAAVVGDRSAFACAGDRWVLCRANAPATYAGLPRWAGAAALGAAAAVRRGAADLAGRTADLGATLAGSANLSGVAATESGVARVGAERCTARTASTVSCTGVVDVVPNAQIRLATISTRRVVASLACLVERPAVRRCGICFGQRGD